MSGIGTIDPNSIPCFPTPFTVYYQINLFNRGFPAQFLITELWGNFPSLTATLYFFGSLQGLLSLAGLIMSIGRTVASTPQDARVYINRKTIMSFNSIWQMALTGLILALPTQWLSNMTMAFILYHAWGEYLNMVLRFMIVMQTTVTYEQLTQFFQWAAVLIVITAVPFMLGSNPYVQGIISTVMVLPADFLNLAIAPGLAYYWLKKSPLPLTAADKACEIFRASLSVIHVIWFYGQGIIACKATVLEGAQFFIAFQIISTFVLLALTISYAISIGEHGEWQEYAESFKKFFSCCCCAIPETDPESSALKPTGRGGSISSPNTSSISVAV